MLLCSQHAFVCALALALLHSLWQGALLGLVGFALHVGLKRATPDTRYGVFSLLLLMFFALWLGTFGCLYEQAGSRVVSVSPGALAGPLTAQQPAFLSASRSAALPLLHPLAPWLVVGWATGVCLLSVRHLGGWLLLRRLCREAVPCLPAWEACAARTAAHMGLRRKIVLRGTAQLDSPCAFGLLRSTVLLPVSFLLGLAPEQVEALLAHEVAHLARQDVFFHLVQVCMETILFYHPVVWWFSRQIRAAREQCCDDLAVGVVGDRALYARALYSLEEARAAIPQLALGARGDTSQMINGQLFQRVQRVLGVSGPEKRTPWAKGALALCAVGIGLVALMPVRAYSRPAQSDAAAAKPVKQQKTVKVVRSMRVTLDINGDKIELNTTDLKADTPVTVNGKKGKFGDLTAQRQQQVRAAAGQVHVSASADGPSASAGAGAPNPNTPAHAGASVGAGSSGGNSRSVSISVENGRTRVSIELNGDKFELNTTDLTPDTPVKVNGRESRFGDLTAPQQKEVREAVSQVHASSSSSSDGSDQG